MIRRATRTALILGLLSLSVALAPSPPGAPEELKALARARLAVARKIVGRYQNLILSPPTAEEHDNPLRAGRRAVQLEGWYLDWAEKVLEAELDLEDEPARRIAAIQSYLDETRKMEQSIREMEKNEKYGVWALDVESFEFRRLQAEYRLAREKLGR